MSDVSHKAVLRLLMSTAELGTLITRCISEASKEPDLANNLPVLVMGALELEGPRRPSMIQAFTGLTSGGVTKLLDRMESHGVIERAYGVIPEDHRAVVVTLTPHGRVVLRSITAAAHDDLEEFRALLKAMSAALDEI